MDDLATFFGGVTLFLGGLFLFIIFGSLTGALAGWIVGLVFRDTILGIFAQLGIHGVTMFQIGAFLGFVGGFMKTKVSASK